MRVLGTCAAIAVTLVMAGTISAQASEDEPPSKVESRIIINKGENKDEHRLVYISDDKNIIVPGDSLVDRQLNDARLAEENSKKTVQRNGRSVAARGATSQRREADSGNTYKNGYCTWYSAEKNPKVPNGWGNAKNWPTNADSPQAGGIVATREGYLGHVAFVEQVVDADTIYVSEMNYAGWNTVSYRYIKWRGNPLIRGFINL